MIRKVLILVAFTAFLQLILVGCVRQQKCNGKFISASLEFGKLPAYDYSSLSYDTVKYDSLLIANNLSTEVYDCSNVGNFNLIQSAYAWKPAPPIVAMQEKLDSIHYVTIRNYNSNYPSGANINNLMLHKFEAYTDWAINGMSTDKALENINSSIKEPSDYFYSSFYSKFKEKPAIQNDTVQIAVTYYLSSGRKLEAVSKPMIVLQ